MPVTFDPYGGNSFHRPESLLHFSTMRTSLVGLRFSELAEVMLEHAGVARGRRFGRECLKLGKHAFIVMDLHVLAFNTGPATPRLVDEMPNTWLWNPEAHPKPKHSWIASLPHDSNQVCTLAVHAYEWVQRKKIRIDCAAESDNKDAY